MGEVERISGELTEQRKTVTEQGQILAVLTSSISEIKSYMRESIEIQREQAVLFEKFANHEEQNNGDHRHIHTRISTVEDDVKELKKNYSMTCDIVRPMAEKGARIHTGMVYLAKSFAGGLALTILAMFYWLIQQGAHK